MYGFVLWILKCKECNIVYSWLAVVVEAGYAYTCVVTAGGGLIFGRNDDGKREFLWQTLCILACLQTIFEHISSEGDPQRLFMKAMAMLTHLGKSLQLCNEHSPHASTLQHICHIVISRVTSKLN